MRSRRNWTPTALDVEYAVDLDYQPVDGSAPFSTMFARCPRCAKEKSRRITALHMARHGVIEPVAYLHAWTQLECPRDRSHAGINPRSGDVDAAVAILGNAEKYLTLLPVFGL